MNYETIIQNIESYKRIGEGGHREVFDIGEGLVLKVAIDYNADIEDAMAVNLNEYRIYHSLEDKGFLCPAVWVSNDGMYLVSKNANLLDKPVTNWKEDELLDYLMSLGCEKYDLDSPFNWAGHYLVDYGVLVFEQTAARILEAEQYIDLMDQHTILEEKNNYAKILDRGIDEVLLIGNEMIRVDKLSTHQLVNLLKKHNLVKNLEYVTFDEYEKSNHSK